MNAADVLDRELPSSIWTAHSVSMRRAPVGRSTGRSEAATGKARLTRNELGSASRPALGLWAPEHDLAATWIDDYRLNEDLRT